MLVDDDAELDILILNHFSTRKEFTNWLLKNIPILEKKSHLEIPAKDEERSREFYEIGPYIQFLFNTNTNPYMRFLWNTNTEGLNCGEVYGKWLEWDRLHNE